MGLIKFICLPLLWCLIWLRGIEAFERYPNLSPFTYYKVTFANQTFQYLNGVYVRQGALQKTGDCGTVNCNGVGDCLWNGTWVYQYQGYYLFEFFNNNKYQAVIATSICETSSWTAISDLSSAGVALGRSQNFSEAASVLWKTQITTKFSLVVSICYSKQPGCSTSSPTNLPTHSPIPSPTRSPTIPTMVPTLPTLTPTKAPTTPEPTRLPTTPTTVQSTTCSVLRVNGLTAIFQGKQSDQRFKILSTSDISDGKRMWSNGRGVTIYFSKRWYPEVGVWVISNGSLSLIKNLTTTTDSAPGTNTGAYGLWDHFTNDNIYQPIQTRITLEARCFSTPWPTQTPTALPTSYQVPPTKSPTMAPTGLCRTLQLHYTTTTCPGSIAGKFGGFYIKQATKFNNKLYFKGTDNTKDATVFWSDLFNAWVVDGQSSLGYSAVASVSSGTYFPPNMTSWVVLDQDQTFSLDCDIVFRMNCLNALQPTTPPTKLPSSTAPTAQTSSPTTRPTKKPTKYPTYSPSDAPTYSPTSAPVAGCDGIEVEGTQDSLSQKYQIALNDTIAGRNYWQAVHGDGMIFYSSSVLHQSWVINSETLGVYWLAHNVPLTQPSSEGEWDKYIESSPFLIKSANLTLRCQRDRFPTPGPTDSPSRAPTRSPSNAPTNSPTQPPTRHPTRSPSSAPTRSPSQPPTRSPSEMPTKNPSNAPTQPPTRIICDYLTVDGPPGFIGNYRLLDNYRNQAHGLWVKVDDPLINITYQDGAWVMLSSHPDQVNDTYVLPSTDWRPPNQGIWYYQSYDSNIYVYVNVDCDLTSHPTSSPTRHPTGAPTRSHCNSIEIYNLTELLSEVSLNIVGWYIKQPYPVNGKSWWMNEQKTEAIKFFDGLWYVLRIDNPQIDTETMISRVLTNVSRFDDRPPVVARWLYPYNPQFSVQLRMVCHGTIRPTSAPVTAPTKMPTSNRAPQWNFCSQKPYFAFATSNQTKIPVYWRIPEATDDQDFTLSLSMRISNTSGVISTLKPVDITTTQPGIYLNVGNRYEFVYVASDTKNAVSNCTVVIYVMQNAPYESFDYCVQNSFSIDVLVNEDDYSVGDKDNEQYTIDLGSVIGKVYLPALVLKKQNCYVRAQLAAQVSPKSDALDTSTYLGIKGSTIMWQLMILTIVLCVLGLTAHAIRNLWKTYCGKCSKNNQDNLIRAIDRSQEEKDAMAGVAPDDMMQKATLINAGNTTATNARRGKSEEKGNSNGGGPGIELVATQAVAENAKANDEPKSYQPPVLPPPGAPPSLPKVPDTEEFWNEALDDLNLKGFRNRSKNLELLVRYALRNSDGTVDKMATASKVSGLLKNLMAKKKLQQEKQNEQGQKLPSPPDSPSAHQQPGATSGNDAVLDMLERDAGLDKEEGDPEPPPPMIPDSMKPPNPVPPPPGRPIPAYNERTSRADDNEINDTEFNL